MLIMKIIVVIILTVILVRLAWWWFVGRNLPLFPPLAINDDDSLMIEARCAARASIDSFKEFLSKSNKGARVKVPFITSSGQREYLWAELRDLREDKMEVLYLTPPVTHSGYLERIHIHPIDELADWQIETESGQYHGGYTMRVMFQRGREQWGSLPAELEAEEKKYL